MKLYWGPHTCAIGIHVLLEEIGQPYETVEIDVAGGATREPAFTTLNPKAKVPLLLRDDGTVLTEYGAIATYLARAYPDARLLPAGPEEEVLAREVMDYVVGTLHAQGFARIFKPGRFQPPDALHEALHLGESALRAQGRDKVGEALDILERQLACRDHVAGGRFTIADSALFYALRWAPQEGIALPPALAAHLARMKARPAVRRVMARWGED